MVALAGTFTSLLVLASATARALGDFPVRVTRQAVLPEPVKTVGAQESDLIAGDPAEVVTGESEMENDLEVLPCVAVIVPVSSALTFEIVAANVALLAPDRIATVAGTLIAEMLLER